LISDALRTQVAESRTEAVEGRAGLSFLRDQEHFYRLDLAVGCRFPPDMPSGRYGISSCSFGCPTEMSPETGWNASAYNGW